MSVTSAQTQTLKVMLMLEQLSFTESIWAVPGSEVDFFLDALVDGGLAIRRENDGVNWYYITQAGENFQSALNGMSSQNAFFP